MSPRTPEPHDKLPSASHLGGIEEQSFAAFDGTGLSSHFSPFSPTMDAKNLFAVNDDAQLPDPAYRSEILSRGVELDAEIPFPDLRVPSDEHSTPRAYSLQPSLVTPRDNSNPSSTGSPIIQPRSHPPMHRLSPPGLPRGRAGYHGMQAKAPTAPLRGKSAWAPTPNLPLSPSRVPSTSTASAAAVPRQTWATAGTDPTAPSPNIRGASSSSSHHLPRSLPVPRSDHPFEAKWSYRPQGSIGSTTDWSYAEAAWSARPNAVLSSPNRIRNASNIIYRPTAGTTTTTVSQAQPVEARSSGSASSSSTLHTGRRHHYHDSLGTNTNSRSNIASSSGPSIPHLSTTAPRNTSTIKGESRVVEQHPDASPERKPYHPKAPSGGSNWVMWVGNVPHDATMEEATEFFNDMTSKALRVSSSAFKSSSLSPQPSSSSSLSSSPANTTTAVTTAAEDTGIESIFLILQSHCAFVNYTSEGHLQRALAYFNGRPFRPGGVKLVCRIRRKAEEIKSGVGGQRGLGLHKKWVEQHVLNNTVDTPSHNHGDSTNINDAIGAISLTSRSTHYRDALERYASHLARTPPLSEGVSSPSNSTTSTLLTQYFPIRYFVLKAMTKSDLQLSANVGLWATQPHNEFVLDQAYRTSKNVYLIFGANKAGEFHGFAKMDGPIHHPMDTQFTLPPREDTPTQQPMSPFESHLRKWDRKLNHSMETEPGGTGQHSSTLRAVKDEDTAAEGIHASQPPAPSLSIPSLVIPASRGSLPPHPPSSSPTVPSLSPPSLLGTTVGGSSRGSVHPFPPLSPAVSLSNADGCSSAGGTLASLSPQSSVITSSDPSTTASVSSVTAAPSCRDGQIVSGGNDGSGGDNGSNNKTQWGTPFRVRWVIARGLPFHLTRILRNPWNKDREVKVSRDGTELEPFVGRALLDLWQVPLPDPADAHASE